MDVLDYRGGSRSLLQPFLQKLQVRDPLSDEERTALSGLPYELRVYSAQEDIAKEGARVEGINLMLRGIATRYKLLADGRRQIVGYCLPGDLCDVRVMLFERMDHSIGALGPVHCALLSRLELHRAMEKYPRIARAIWRSTLADESITREWIVNVGYRSAFERLAHLLCELYLRLECVGLARDLQCDFPFRQSELADTLALSAVHVNRTLMEMRRNGLVSLSGRQLIIHDMARLQVEGGFDSGYLHLEDAAAAPTVPPPPPLSAEVG